MLSTFDVLAEPNRRRILDELCQGERTVNELVERLSLSQPAVSKHLRVLRDAELVTARIDKQHRRYRLRPEPLAEIDDWLAPYRQFWADRLDALQAHLINDLDQEGNSPS
ncbi:MAG TPA: metalloregulator ArsR/SmtB family transcription factor [Thermomicrobiales bacterium]|nr:metalloregulator ArsR/SmtB family transcription factor [Thermomicrobiales bacterium]